jgi:predicted transcriptional regulator
MEKKQRDEMLEALENVKHALETARPHIDELNGYLEELTHHHRLDEEDASEDSLETLSDLYDFYMELPVWDTIDTYIERIERVEKELHCSCKEDEDTKFFQNHGCCESCHYL